MGTSIGNQQLWIKPLLVETNGVLFCFKSGPGKKFPLPSLSPFLSFLTSGTHL